MFPYGIRLTTTSTTTRQYLQLHTNLAGSAGTASGTAPWPFVPMALLGMTRWPLLKLPHALCFRTQTPTNTCPLPSLTHSCSGLSCLVMTAWP